MDNLVERLDGAITDLKREGDTLLVCLLTDAKREIEGLRQQSDVIEGLKKELTTRTIYADEAVDEANRLRAALSANHDLKEALRPLAVLEVPDGIRWNAGHYLIRFADIERAKDIVDSTATVK